MSLCRLAQGLLTGREQGKESWALEVLKSVSPDTPQLLTRRQTCEKVNWTPTQGLPLGTHSLILLGSVSLRGRAGHQDLGMGWGPLALLNPQNEKSSVCSFP